MSRSLEKSLREAQIHINAGRVSQAGEIYRHILSRFPKNKKAIQAYKKLTTLPQNEVDILINLFKTGQMNKTVELGQALVTQFPNTLILYEILGAAYMSMGNNDKSIRCYNKLLQFNPKHIDAHNNLGLIYYDQGMFSKAVESYQKALEFEPNFADAHYNLGNALTQAGNLRRAIESYKASLAIKPQDTEILTHYANALKDYGQFDKAIEIYARVLEASPDLSNIRANMDSALRENEEMNNLIMNYSKKIKQDLSSAKVIFFKGTLFNMNGFSEYAIDSFRKALKIKPDYAKAYNGIGIAFKNQGDLDKAVENYRWAINFEPSYAEAYNNLGNALKDKKNYSLALKAYRQAIEIDPSYADIFNNMGITLREVGDVAAAIVNFEKAIEINPKFAEAHWHQCLAYLSKEDFEKGWSAYDWRWEVALEKVDYLSTSKPLWQYSRNQRVLLWAEQGIGDEVMFASIIPELHALCSKLIVHLDERLIPLFSRSFPSNIEYRPRHKTIYENEYDTHIPMGSLPQYFRKTVESFKSTSRGWLSANEEQAKGLREKLLTGDTEKLIGISWHSTIPRLGAEAKVISLAQLAKKLQAPKIKLINLQYGDVDEELCSLRKESGIEIVQVSEIDNKNDIDGLASLILACDKIVTISNVTIHLAGALGKEADVLLASSSDWRWGQKPNTSYWYDSVRLHRQTKIDDWHEVLKNLQM